MNKIPTLFVRNPERMQLVTNEVTPGCEWVLAGEGVATRKFDGTNVRMTVQGGTLVVQEQRRNPTREEKAKGAEPSYVVIDTGDPSNKHILTAVDATNFGSWPDGSWSCEAVGPKIQGGVEGLPPSLIPFSLPKFTAEMGVDAPRSFDDLGPWLAQSGFEGLVWHHPDGRMAKIKAKDFGHKRRAT